MTDLSRRVREQAEGVAAQYTDRAHGATVDVKDRRDEVFFLVAIENGMYSAEVPIHAGGADAWDSEIEAAFETLRSER